MDELTSEEERLFYRLLVNCDDFGRFNAKAAIVRNECFRLNDGKIKIETVEKWLNRLCEVGLIIIYENSGKRYLQFVTWHDHQQRRAAKSKYPAFDDEGSILISNDINCNQMKPVPAELDRLRISISNTNSNIGGYGGKEKYADYVMLTPEEHQKLVAKFGEAGTKDKIEALNLWKGSKGKRTASDYMTILNWARREDKDKPPDKPQSRYRDMTNYEP